MTFGGGLIGRQTELAQMASALALAKQTRRPVVVALLGDAGLGKSRLLSEFAEAARRGGATAVHVEARSELGAYSLIRRMEKALILRPRSRRRAALAARVVKPWLAVVPVFGAMIAAVVDSFLAFRQERRVSATDYGLSDLIDTLRRFSRRGPIVLGADDLQWADAHSLDMLLQIVRYDEDPLPLLAVFAFEPGHRGTDGGRSRIERLILRLAGHVEIITLELSPWSEPETAAYLQEATGQYPDRRLLASIFASCGGNPLMTALAVHAAKDDGAMPINATTTRRQLIERIVDRAREAHQNALQVLEAASILGVTFWTADIRSILPDLADLPEVMDCLQDMRIIVPIPVGQGGNYRFQHALIRSHLAERLSADPYRVRDMHLRVAKGMEQQTVSYARNLDWYEAASRHYALAGCGEDQHRVLSLAAGISLGRGSWRPVVAAWIQAAAQSLGPEADQRLRGRFWFLAAEQFNVAQQFAAAAAAAAKAWDLADAVDDSAVADAASRLLAGIEWSANPHFGELDRLARLAQQRGDAGDRSGQLQALLDLSWIAMRQRQWHIASQAIESAQQLVSRGVGPALYAVQAVQVAGEIKAEQQHWPQAVDDFGKALKLAKRLPAQTRAVAVCAAQGWLGLCLLHIGQADNGHRLLTEALETETFALRSMEGSAKWLTRIAAWYLEEEEPRQASSPLWLAEMLYRQLDHQELATVREHDSRLKRQLGDEYDELREEWDPQDSRWARYGFLWEQGPFTKHAGNPILGPGEQAWRGAAVFNPAAWIEDDQVQVLFRADDKPAPGPKRSVLGSATSSDGRSFAVGDTPAFEPAEDYELPQGCEDPRVVLLDGRLFLTYTAFDGRVARLCTAIREPDKSWHKFGPAISDDEWESYFPRAESPITPRGWTKSGALIPQKINGRWWMYFGDTHIWVASSTDLRHWQVEPEPVLSPRPGSFDSQLVEPGPPPAVYDDGIVLMYNSADTSLRYAVGQALFSRTDPAKLLRRSARPTLQPEHRQEVTGNVNNVVFASGLVTWRDELLLYYGMADGHVGLATAPLRRPPAQPRAGDVRR